MDIQTRAIAAAGQFIQNLGYTQVREVTDPPGFTAYDQGVSVYVRVVVGKDFSDEWEPDQLMSALTDRTDTIQVLPFSENRALLRHSIGEVTAKESGDV